MSDPASSSASRVLVDGQVLDGVVGGELGARDRVGDRAGDLQECGDGEGVHVGDAVDGLTPRLRVELGRGPRHGGEVGGGAPVLREALRSELEEARRVGRVVQEPPVRVAPQPEISDRAGLGQVELAVAHVELGVVADVAAQVARLHRAAEQDEIAARSVPAEHRREAIEGETGELGVGGDVPELVLQPAHAGHEGSQQPGGPTQRDGVERAVDRPIRADDRVPVGAKGVEVDASVGELECVVVDQADRPDRAVGQVGSRVGQIADGGDVLAHHGHGPAQPEQGAGERPGCGRELRFGLGQLVGTGRAVAAFERFEAFGGPVDGRVEVALMDHHPDDRRGSADRGCDHQSGCASPGGSAPLGAHVPVAGHPQGGERDDGEDRGQAVEADAAEVEGDGGEQDADDGGEDAVPPSEEGHGAADAEGEGRDEQGQPGRAERQDGTGEDQGPAAGPRRGDDDERAHRSAVEAVEPGDAGGCGVGQHGDQCRHPGEDGDRTELLGGGRGSPAAPRRRLGGGGGGGGGRRCRGMTDGQQVVLRRAVVPARPARRANLRSR